MSWFVIISTVSDFRCDYFHGVSYSILSASVTLHKIVIGLPVSNCDLKTLQEPLIEEIQRSSNQGEIINTPDDLLYKHEQTRTLRLKITFTQSIEDYTPRPPKSSLKTLDNNVNSFIYGSRVGFYIAWEKKDMICCCL